MTNILENYENTKIITEARRVMKDVAQIVYGDVQIPGAKVEIRNKDSSKKEIAVGMCNCNCDDD